MTSQTHAVEGNLPPFMQVRSQLKGLRCNMPGSQLLGQVNFATDPCRSHTREHP